jgi:hypothetical protein
MRFPLIINETGNIFMFDTREQAEAYLEAVDVEDSCYVGYDSEGRLLRLKVRYIPPPVGFRNRLRQALHGGALSRVELELSEIEPRHAAELHQALKQI